MKRVIIYILLLFSCVLTFGQKFTREVTHRKPTINEFIFWEHVYEENTNEEGKVEASLIEELSGFDDYGPYPIIKDSIQMTFKVGSIKRVNNFYTLKKNKIVKAEVYYIYLNPFVDGNTLKRSFNYFGKLITEEVTYGILTVCKESNRKDKKIKKGDIYNFTIYTFFDKKLPLLYSGAVCPLFIDNACNLTYSMGVDGNFYSTPNLNGLYYKEDGDE